MQKGALRPNADQRAINRGFAARGQVRATNVPYRARANRCRRSNEPMMAGP